MKLLLCEACWDVRKLGSKKTFCACRKSWGWYTDDINAVYGGQAVMLGIANGSLAQAIEASRTKGPLMQGRREIGRGFTAFIVPESAPTVSREPE